MDGSIIAFWKNFQNFCAGSLIHKQVVLNAAHCVESFRTGSLTVRAGEWDTQTMKERLPYYNPDYNRRSIAYDFALVILSQPITLDDHINVICLPQQDDIPQPGNT